MTAEIRPVEIEAYLRARQSLARMLDNLADARPRTVCTALYEQPPPSMLSTHDPILGRFAWTLLRARGDAGDDYYIPKIASICARTIGTSRGEHSVELREAMAIIRDARRARATRVRPAALAKARARLQRHETRRDGAHRRVLHAARQLWCLHLRACRDQDAAEVLERALTGIGDSTAMLTTLAMFTLHNFADDLAELGEYGQAAAMDERANTIGQTVPDREDIAMLADWTLFRHCASAGLAVRCGELATAAGQRVDRHPDPEFRAAHLIPTRHHQGRAALLRHDHRGAAEHLRQALDADAHQPRRDPQLPQARRDLLYALAAEQDPH